MFRIAFVPALLSIVVLSLIKDQPGIRHQREIIFETCKSISPEFKRFLAVAGIFSLAYFSFGFLLWRAHSVGFAVKDTVLLYALFNVAFVVAAPLIGKRGDIVGSARMIMLGYLTPLLMSLGFAFAATRRQVIVLFIAYGLFYAIDEAQSKAFIADPESERRASAIIAGRWSPRLLLLRDDIAPQPSQALRSCRRVRCAARLGAGSGGARLPARDRTGHARSRRRATGSKTIAYNGQVPGPLLRLKEGQPVTIEVTNRTETPGSGALARPVSATRRRRQPRGRYAADRRPCAARATPSRRARPAFAGTTPTRWRWMISHARSTAVSTAS